MNEKLLFRHTRPALENDDGFVRLDICAVDGPDQSTKYTLKVFDRLDGPGTGDKSGAQARIDVCVDDYEIDPLPEDRVLVGDTFQSKNFSSILRMGLGLMQDHWETGTPDAMVITNAGREALMKVDGALFDEIQAHSSRMHTRSIPMIDEEKRFIAGLYEDLAQATRSDGWVAPMTLEYERDTDTGCLQQILVQMQLDDGGFSAHGELRVRWTKEGWLRGLELSSGDEEGSRRVYRSTLNGALHRPITEGPALIEERSHRIEEERAHDQSGAVYAMRGDRMIEVDDLPHDNGGDDQRPDGARAVRELSEGGYTAFLRRAAQGSKAVEIAAARIRAKANAPESDETVIEELLGTIEQIQAAGTPGPHGRMKEMMTDRSPALAVSPGVRLSVYYAQREAEACGSAAYRGWLEAGGRSILQHEGEGRVPKPSLRLKAAAGDQR